MARSAHTEPTTVPPAPSRQETLPAASSWRSAQTPLPPASTASSPNPTRHPPRQHYTTITAAGFCRGSLGPPDDRAVRHLMPLCRWPRSSSGGAGGGDQLPIEPAPVVFAAAVLDRSRALLGQAPAIAPL